MPEPLEIALLAANAAADAVTRRLGDAGRIHTKLNRTDLVSEADLAAEAILVATIQQHFPSHVIVSEEGATGGSDLDLRWIIDPIDGTMNFVHGHPFWCISIAYEEYGQLTAGVILAPTLRETFAAERGKGATLNGQPVRVSDTALLADSLISSGFHYDVDARVANGRVWQAMLPLARGIRRDGSAALDLAFVAAGRFDGYWERPLNAWDIAAGILLIQEAGGKVTNYLGEPVDLARPEIAASNGIIHDELLAGIAVALA